MVTQRRTAAPNAEWVLMYRGGLTRGQIAKLVGAATSTVGYHLAAARSADPGLQAAHEAAAALKTRHEATAEGLVHMSELKTFLQAAGRYPSRIGGTLSERTLAAWLQRRREDARADTLAEAYREGLAVVPDWQIRSRAEADEARWQQRLEALAEYRAAATTGPAQSQRGMNMNMIWVCGCTTSGPNCTVANWTRPKRRNWTARCPAGARAGSVEGSRTSRKVEKTLKKPHASPQEGVE